MKCNNCGYMNDAQCRKCIKCNSNLVPAAGQASKANPDNTQTLTGKHLNGAVFEQSFGSSNNDNNANNFAKTLLGEQAKSSYIDRPSANVESNTNMDSNMAQCSFCGYQVMSNANFCPNCNKEIKMAKDPKYSKESQDFNGTINPYSKHGFSLKPLINGEPAGFKIEYTGPTELNRENTLKDNMTITSKVQAEIKLENGEWFLIDRSEQQTTFIRPGEAIKLKKGDIILLGDTKFIFE